MSIQTCQCQCCKRNNGFNSLVFSGLSDPDANAVLLREIETVLSSCDEELDAYLSGFPKEDYKTVLFAVDYSHRKIVKLLSKLKSARGGE